MHAETMSNAGSRRPAVMSWFAALLALVVAIGVVLPVSAADGDVDVSITVEAGGEPLAAATVTLAADGVSVTASETGDGVYTAAVAEGTYLLSIDPPSESLYERYEDPDFEVSGPTVTTIALFLPTVDPDPDPEPDPDDPEPTVSGSVRNGAGGADVNLQVSFVNDGVTVEATTDANGDYEMVVPPGEWQVSVRRPFTPFTPAGWPTFFDITSRDLVIVGDEPVRFDMVLPFVEQTVRVLLPDGSPAAGYRVTLRANTVSPEIPDESDFSSTDIQNIASTSPEGVVRLMVLEGRLGSGFVRAEGAGTYLNVEVALATVTERLPTAEPIVLQFTESRTLTGQLRNLDGQPVRGFVSVRSDNGTFGGRFDTGTDGNFEVVVPTAPGPYVLTGRDFRTNVAWRFESAPLDDESDEIGAVVLPQTRVDVCVVDEVAGTPVDTTVTVNIAETLVPEVPIGSADLTADFTLSRQLSVRTNAARCIPATTLLPAGVDVDVTLIPNRYSDYYPTDATVDTRPDAGPVALRLGRFDQLSDSVAVDVGLQLVNGLGIGLGELPMDLRTNPTTRYSRLQVTDSDGRVDVRLAREKYDLREIRFGRVGYPSARGFTSATGGASPDGRYDISLSLDQVSPSVTRYDLGTVVLPFVPVDVSVRGASREPLAQTILETPRVQACTLVDDVLREVCASSAYSDTEDLRRPGVTNEFGRERLWLVPGVHQLTVTPAAADLADGYQTQTVPVTVPEGGRGQSVFVVLQNPSGSADPDPSPQISVGGPYVVAEGDTVQLEAEELAGSPDEWAWDLDGDGNFESSGQSVTFDATNRTAPGTATVRVRACDAQDRCTVDATTVTILNADTTQPDEPDEPDDPDTTEPDDPDTTEPDDPDEPDTTEPDDPDTTQPTTPDTTQPDDPDTTQPTTPDTTQPDAVEADQPEVVSPLPTELPTDEPTLPDPAGGTQLPATGSALVVQLWLALLASLSGLALLFRFSRRFDTTK